MNIFYCSLSALNNRKTASFFALYFLVFSRLAFALPVWFLQQNPGNMRDINWSVSESSHFKVYYDPKSEFLARHAIDSSEYAYQFLSPLMGK